MTPAEALKVVAYLEAAYGKELAQPTKAVYTEHLIDLPFDAGMDAARRLVDTAKWIPSVAELREAVVEAATDLPLPEEAWPEAVSCAISMWDGLRFVAAPDYYPREIVRAVMSMGVDTIRLSDTSDPWPREHFMRIYRVIRERSVREHSYAPALPDATPPELLEIAGDIVGPPEPV